MNTHADAALQHGDRHRLGGDHLLHARGQDLVEQGGGGVGEALVDGVWGHVHAEPPATPHSMTGSANAYNSCLESAVQWSWGASELGRCAARSETFPLH